MKVLKLRIRKLGEGGKPNGTPSSWARGEPSGQAHFEPLNFEPAPVTIMRQNKKTVGSGAAVRLWTTMRIKGESLGSRCRACNAPVRSAAKEKAGEVIMVALLNATNVANK